MGGRMGTMLAAEGLECPGVVCFAYPLHPAGRPERLRIEHLPDITVPKLFFQGSRDALATPALFDVHVRPLPDTTVVDLEGADHSFRGKSWSPERVWALLADRTREWIDLRVGGKRPGSR